MDLSEKQIILIKKLLLTIHYDWVV